jgi:hypothetical protein
MLKAETLKAEMWGMITGITNLRTRLRLGRQDNGQRGDAHSRALLVNGKDEKRSDLLIDSVTADVVEVDGPTASKVLV